MTLTGLLPICASCFVIIPCPLSFDDVSLYLNKNHFFQPAFYLSPSEDHQSL